MATDLANALVVSDETAKQKKKVLGFFVMATQPDDERDEAQVRAEWINHGLDPDDLPEMRELVHVFQTAAAHVKARRSVDGKGKRTEITADEVHNNGGGCIYQITVKIWDRTNDVIEWEKALRVTFDKVTSKISFDHLGAKDRRLSRIEREIQEHFDANTQTIPGQKVRNAVRRTLLKIGAQNLRRKAGGVYFVPSEWKPNGKMEPTRPILDGIKGMLTALYGQRADFYIFPMANDETEREMVRKHFTLNVREKTEELMLKTLQRVQAGRGRGVRPELLANLYNERRRLAQAIGQFDQLVSLEKTEIENDLEDFDDALDKLEQLANEKE